VKRKKNTGRLVLAAAAAAAASLISGCDLSALTAENVMEPPQPFGDGAAIQAVLEEALGPQITLRYPRSGEYRSAVVRADVDNDSNEEAIVSYRQATENTGAHMALLDINEEEEWALIGEYSGSEGEIDRVMFGDVDGDGVQDIITGWSVHSDYGTLRVHSCANGRLTSLSIDSSPQTGAGAYSSYSELSVVDFDRDSVDELLTVCLPGDENSGVARLMEWNKPIFPGGSGRIILRDSITLSAGTKAYTGCAAGQLSRSVYGFVVDSQRTDGSYSSEVLVWDSEAGRLTSPSEQEGSKVFSRTLTTASMDIDGDGYIEIPDDSLMPDCDTGTAGKVYMTDWYRYGESGFVRDFSSVMRLDYGYYFILPESWRGIVTAQPDNETRSLHFYLANSGYPFSNELMCIKVFTLDEWEEENSGGWNEEPSGYIELYTADYYVYAVQLFSSPPYIEVTLEMITECFVLQV